MPATAASLPPVGVRATGLGHRFLRAWLFRHLDFAVPPGGAAAVLGANGSGKSTLLRIVAGQLAPAEGSLAVVDAAGTPLPPEDRYRDLSWAAPAIEPYTVLTLAETLRLHYRLRTCTLPGGTAEWLDLMALTRQANQPLRQFSSGMLQRVRIGLALFTQSRLLLLDEPTSNLDAANTTRMLQLVAAHQGQRTLLLASNQPHEYEGLTQRIRLD